jgi:hypothetical protein
VNAPQGFFVIAAPRDDWSESWGYGAAKVDKEIRMLVNFGLVDQQNYAAIHVLNLGKEAKGVWTAYEHDDEHLCGY